jgi:CRP-like cAMP-binding protein
MSLNIRKNYSNQSGANVLHFPLVKIKDVIRLPKPVPRRKTQNELLANLSQSVYSELEPFMQKVLFERGETMFEPKSKMNYVYFPDNLIASRLALMEGGSMIEVGMIGHEGMLGVRALMGSETANYLTLAETEGSAVRINTKKLKEFFERSIELQNAFLQFYEKFLTQVSQKAACRCRHKISQQLCTWLLQFQERTASEELLLTQETIASRLGARRSSITVAINDLEAKKIIVCGRGHIKILDRVGLSINACECYEVLQS